MQDLIESSENLASHLGAVHKLCQRPKGGGGGPKCLQWLIKGGGGGRQMLTLADKGGGGQGKC